MPDLLAHHEQDGLDALDQRAALGRGAEHEGQGARARADDAAGHGRVDEAARQRGVDGVGDLLGRGRVDGGGVDEEALLGQLWERATLENAVEDVLDVFRFRETGDDGFLELQKRNGYQSRSTEVCNPLQIYVLRSSLSVQRWADVYLLSLDSARESDSY